jgi:hypothetical protein
MMSAQGQSVPDITSLMQVSDDYVRDVDPHRHQPLRQGDRPLLGPDAPLITHRSAWLDHNGDLPVLHGTLIRLQVERLPGDRDPKPVWLWSSRTGATHQHIDRLWQAFLRRFDPEHTGSETDARLDRPEDP